MPVEDLAPKAKASNVTLNRDNPLSPAFETPIKNAAVTAKAQPDKETFADSNKTIEKMLNQK